MSVIHYRSGHLHNWCVRVEGVARTICPLLQLFSLASGEPTKTSVYDSDGKMHTIGVWCVRLVLPRPFLWSVCQGSSPFFRRFVWLFSFWSVGTLNTLALSTDKGFTSEIIEHYISADKYLILHNNI